MPSRVSYTCPSGQITRAVAFLRGMYQCALKPDGSYFYATFVDRGISKQLMQEPDSSTARPTSWALATARSIGPQARGICVIQASIDGFHRPRTASGFVVRRWRA
jgi:hypothetical protein